MLCLNLGRRPVAGRLAWPAGALCSLVARALALAGALLLGSAHAATAVPAPGVPGSAVTEPSTATPATGTAVRFTTDIDAPPAIKTLLERHLNIQRFHALPDLDEAELRRLVSQLPADAKSLLGTQGHFAPRLTAELLPPEAAAPARNAAWTVRVTVEPGPVAQVGEVVLSLGPPAPDNNAQAVSQQVHDQWPLATGQAFTQARWTQAKADALRRLQSDRFPRARLTGSLADVDTETQRVNLAVEIDTGPAFTLGPVRIDGLSRYESVWVEHMLKVGGAAPGQPYRLADLQSAQQRLSQSGYFESVFVFVDPDADPAAAPIRVQVREATRGKLVLGVGVSTDHGPRLSAEHTWNRVPWLDHRALSKLQLQNDQRTLRTELKSPVDSAGWHWSTTLQAERISDTASSSTTSQQLKWGQVQDGEQLSRGYFVQYDRALTDSPLLRAAGPVESDQSLTLNYAWSRPRFDNMPLPTQGEGLAAEVGVGTTLNQQRRPFVRSRVRWQGLFPLSASAGRLAMRLEGGAILSAATAPVPDSQRFWAGGDQSVRGYAPRGLGVAQTDGSLLPGRVLAVGSLEWQRPILSQGQPTNWESTLFVDAGSVADRVTDLKPKFGVGAGVRYNSPVGPLQMDVAYGLATRRLRLHLSVGFAF